MALLKSFDQFIYESAETANSENTTVTYFKPATSELSKDTSNPKLHNIIKFKSGTVTRKYKVVGNMLGKNYDLNFKWIKKKDNGDLIFARTVEGGVDPETIPVSDMHEILSNMLKGYSDINPSTGLHFYKIS